MGYEGPDGAEGVSNSYDTNLDVNLQPTPQLPAYDREVALISADGKVNLTPESNAYSGDNPRGAITVDGNEFYMAGNSDSTTYTPGQKFKPSGTATCADSETVCGPGTTIGARYGTPGSPTSYQLGVYTATDRTDESAKQHIKDNNFRGIGIFNGNLYVSKGSGGNGDDGLYQVGTGLPTGTANTITFLFGDPATLPGPPPTNTPGAGATSPFTPFGFFFANPTTVYVADEGNPNLDASGNLLPTPDPMAGLEKWSLVGGTWVLDYTIQNGLNLNQPVNIPGYPVPTYTYGLRNITGQVNFDGTVTIYAITAQWSTISGGEPDPTNLVAVTDRISATSLPSTHFPDLLDHFIPLQNSGAGQVFRGVAFAPCGYLGNGDGDYFHFGSCNPSF